MHRVLFGIVILGTFLRSPVWGQDNSTTQPSVTRQEFDQLKQDNAEMKQELSEIKKQQTDQTTNSDQDAQDNDKTIKALRIRSARRSQVSKALSSPATPPSVIPMCATRLPVSTPMSAR